MTPPWVNIVKRAVALGVIPYGEGYTVRFTIFHAGDCMSCDALSLKEQGIIPEDFPEDQLCDCTPAVMWREVCDPVDHFNIIIDKSSSKGGLI